MHDHIAPEDVDGPTHPDVAELASTRHRRMLADLLDVGHALRSRCQLRPLAAPRRLAKRRMLAVGATAVLLTGLAAGGLVARADTPEFRVNSATTTYQSFPSVATDTVGDVVVVWQSLGQDGDNYGIYAQRYDQTGTEQGGVFQVNTYTTSKQDSPRVAMDARGDFVVTWESYGQDGSQFGIYARRYNNAGVAQGGEFRVNTYTAGNQSGPSVAMDRGGDFVIAWNSKGQDGDGYGVYAQRYSSAGAAQGSEFRVNTYTAGNQSNPSVAMDVLGDVVVTWQSNGQPGGQYDDIYARRYNNGSMTWGPEFRVNTYTSGSQTRPSVAMDYTGDFVVAWQSYGQNGLKGDDVYAQRYDGSANKLGNEFRVNTTTTSDQNSPNVAMDSTGDFVVTWESFVQDGDGYGIYAQRYNNTAAAQGSEFRVNTYTTSDQEYPSVAIHGSNGSYGFVVAWQSKGQDGPGYGVYAQRYDSASAAQGREFRVGGDPKNYYARLSVARDSAGDFVVAWMSKGQDGSGYGIYARRYNSAGVAQGSEFLVNTTTANNQKNPSVAMDGQGDFVVTWESNGQDGSGYGIYARRYNNQGVPQGSEFLVNTYITNDQRNPSVAMDSAGDFVVAWNSYYQVTGQSYDVYARRYTSTGAAQGSEFLVNTFTKNDQYNPSVAMDGRGDFVVAWTSSGQDGGGIGVFAQRYDKTAAPQGSEFQVNTYTTREQSQPSVAMDSAGDFVVGWFSYGQDGSSGGIYAQRYSSAGVKQGSEFRVNTYTTGLQSFQSVAMDGAGDFVVTWLSNGQDGSGLGVYGQRYTSAGVKQGSEFLVNTYTTNDQSNPSVAMDSAGDFVVAWFSYGQGGSGTNVYARQYSAPATPTSTPTNTATSTPTHTATSTPTHTATPTNTVTTRATGTTTTGATGTTTGAATRTATGTARIGATSTATGTTTTGATGTTTGAATRTATGTANTGATGTATSASGPTATQGVSRNTLFLPIISTGD